MTWFLAHLPLLLSVVFGGGGLEGLRRYLTRRLLPDQRSCVDVMEQLELANDKLELITGHDAAVAADAALVRGANKHRRRAGTGMTDIFPGELFNPFRSRLSDVDQRLRDVEDRINSTAGPVPVRAACDNARTAIHDLRRYFRDRTRRRLSVIVFGSRKFDLKAEKED